MSLVLVWNDDATPHADRDLLTVATFVVTTNTETFNVCQADMVTAFRLLVARKAIDHTQITLRVSDLTISFNQDGDLVYPAGWPVPTYAQDLLCNLRMEVRWKKLAAKLPQVVD